ncbi:MAG: DUF998 domain-containing protein [Anaerolineales bacterium]|nr:DUF998 domain-containing protein [Anaerolineales bacterium]
MNVAYTSIVFAIVFLALLALLHFLKPELDPSWRMISEYEIGRFGWLMRLAFFSWGASVVALLVAIWPWLQPIAGTIARWWFVLIAIALFGAGIFKTDPITDITDSVVNRLHTICGAIVILTFPIAATLANRGLTRDPLWSARQGLLIVVTALTWIGVVSFFASIGIARRRDPSAGAGGPTIRMGWPNRFMVVTYAGWIIVVAAISLRL